MTADNSLPIVIFDLIIFIISPRFKGKISGNEFNSVYQDPCYKAMPQKAKN